MAFLPCFCAFLRGEVRRHHQTFLGISCSIREHGSILCLGMAKDILNSPCWCTSRIPGYEAKTKHADGIILPAGHINSLKYTLEFVGAEKQVVEIFQYLHLLIVKHSDGFG